MEHSHETRPPLRPLAVTNLRGRLHRGNSDLDSRPVPNCTTDAHVMDILYSAIAIAIVFVILGRVFDDRNQ